MSKLTEAMKVIKEECEKHIMCRHCALYGDEGCIVEPCPSNWKINEDMALPSDEEVEV